MSRIPNIEPSPYPDKSKIEPRIDPNVELGRAISRCFYAVSVGDDALLSCALDSLKTAVPNSLKEIVDEIGSECTTIVPTWKRPRHDGWGLSVDPLAPAIMNDKEDLHYNPHFKGRRFEQILDEQGNPTDRWKAVTEEGGIHWMSPVYSEEPITDYNQEFRRIMTALEDHGLWWTDKKDAEQFKKVVK